VSVAALALVALLAMNGAIDDAATKVDASPAAASATPAIPVTPVTPVTPTPLVRCTQQAKDDVDGGARCLQALVDAGGVDAADAAEALRVLVRLRRHRPAPSSPAVPHFTLTSVWAQRGVVEAGLHGVVVGGVGGFVGASAIVAGLRTSEADSLPWLIAAPVVGALLGGAMAVAGVTLAAASPDDIALVASTTWAGLLLSTGLQLSMLYGSVDVAAPALGFSTMIVGGALGLGAGVVLAPYVDATAGDVALANSALVWGGVLGALTVSTSMATGATLDFADAALWTTTSAGALWLATLALHPWLSLHRLSTWLVDAGGVAGFLLASSVAVAVAPRMSGNSGLFVGSTLTAGTLAGLVVGGVAAVAVDAQLGDSFDDDGAPPPLLSRVAPAVLPTPEGHTAAGVVVEVARW